MQFRHAPIYVVRDVRPTKDRIQSTAPAIVHLVHPRRVRKLEGKSSSLATVLLISPLWPVAATQACIRAILIPPLVDKILENRYPLPLPCARLLLLRCHVRYSVPTRSY